MQRKAKIFINNRNQAVRLPKEFQFNTREVFIRKEGSDVVPFPDLSIGPPVASPTESWRGNLSWRADQGIAAVAWFE